MEACIVGGSDDLDDRVELAHVGHIDTTALSVVPIEEKRLVMITLVHFTRRAGSE
jgi:hypothetical protein